jgi:hypothetical protein
LNWAGRKGDQEEEEKAEEESLMSFEEMRFSWDPKTLETITDCWLCVHNHDLGWLGKRERGAEEGHGAEGEEGENVSRRWGEVRRGSSQRSHGAWELVARRIACGPRALPNDKKRSRRNRQGIKGGIEIWRRYQKEGGSRRRGGRGQNEKPKEEKGTRV